MSVGYRPKAEGNALEDSYLLSLVDDVRYVVGWVLHGVQSSSSRMYAGKQGPLHTEVAVDKGAGVFQEEEGAMFAAFSCRSS